MKIPMLCRNIAILACLSLAVAPAFGQNTVVSNNNPATFSSAVAAGGTVTFAFNGTITLTNTIVVTNNVLVDATGYNITISGGSNLQIFIVNSNASLALNNLTLANGNYVWVINSLPYISSYGGAINNGGSLVITGCTFSNNAANASFAIGDAGRGRGGAIFNEGSLVVSNSFFLQNSARGNDGFEMSNPVGAEGSGGAIYNAGTALIANCSFFSNTAAAGNGQSSTGQGGNGGPAYGGAICTVGTLALFNSTFLQNASIGGSGAGGFQVSGEGSQPYGGGNGGAGNGGAVCSVSGNSIIINSTFANNLAEGSGAGAGGGGIDAGSFSDNPNGANGGNGGNGIGGGISLFAGALSLTNVTCVNNVATGGLGGAGGGASQYPYGSANGANGVPGVGQGDTIGNAGGTFFVKNSIVYCAAEGTNGFGSIFDAGNNINSDATDLFTNSTSYNNTNPLLGTLGNYGGPTQTVPLLLGSPAINAADPLAFPPTDQRGYPRPSGSAPDIGAFEYTYPTLSGILAGHGGIQIVLTSDFGSTAILEISSNLIIWSPLSTNLIATGPTVISDATATNANRRFYRVIAK